MSTYERDYYLGGGFEADMASYRQHIENRVDKLCRVANVAMIRNFVHNNLSLYKRENIWAMATTMEAWAKMAARRSFSS